MIVKGNGLLARAFLACSDADQPVYLFACGVSNSQMQSEEEYKREKNDLLIAIREAKEMDYLFVYFSGAPIYGDFSRLVSESNACVPVTRYGRHQLEAERFIGEHADKYLFVRLSNVVGLSTNTSQLIPSLVRQVAMGKVNVMNNAWRDLVDVEDIVRLVQGLITQSVVNEAVNVVSGQSLPISSIVTIISEVLSFEPKIQYTEQGDAQHFDNSLLKLYLGDLPFNESYTSRTLHRYVPKIYENLRTR